jgi:DedD protein
LSSTVENAPIASVVQTAALEPAPVIEQPVIEASKIAPVALPGKLVTHQAEKTAVVSDTVPADKVAEAAIAVVTEKPAAIQESISTPKPIPTKKPIERPATKIPEPKTEPKKVVNPADILEGKQFAAVATSAPTNAKKTYYIQVGAYADAEKAAELVGKLKNAGVKASSEKIKTSKGELTRVRVGPTTDEAKAKAWIKVMQDIGVSGSLIAKAPQ